MKSFPMQLSTLAVLGLIASCGASTDTKCTDASRKAPSCAVTNANGPTPALTSHTATPDSTPRGPLSHTTGSAAPTSPAPSGTNSSGTTTPASPAAPSAPATGATGPAAPATGSTNPAAPASGSPTGPAAPATGSTNPAAPASGGPTVPAAPGTATSTNTGATTNPTAPAQNPLKAGSGLTFSDVTGESMTLNWGAATSNTTALALAPTMPVVAYKVVCVSAVASENIDTVEAINMITTAEAGLVMDWTVGATDVTLTSLKPSTTYTCNVAARDEAGNEVAYVAASQGTSGDATTASKDAKTELNK